MTIRRMDEEPETGPVPTSVGISPVRGHNSTVANWGISAERTEAPTGIEPVEAILRPLEPKIRLYVEHFKALRARDE
jgi:hypothetical protein